MTGSRPTSAPSTGQSYNSLAAAASQISERSVANPICQQCSAQKGPKGEALLICSKCRHSRYRSKACQLVHWPAHRAMCRRNALSADQGEAIGLAAPASAMLYQDADKLLKDIYFDLVVTLRSAMLIGSASPRHKTLLLALQLEYNPKPTLLRQRFALGKVELRTHEQQIALSVAHEASVRRLQARARAEDGYKPPAHALDAICCDVVLEAILPLATPTSDGKRFQMIRKHCPIGISLQSHYGALADYRSLRPNPGWEAALRFSLSQPTARDHQLLAMEDLLASMGADWFMEAQEKWEAGEGEALAKARSKSWEKGRQQERKRSPKTSAKSSLEKAVFSVDELNPALKVVFEAASWKGNELKK